MDNLNLNISSIDLDKAEKGTWIEYDEGISFMIAKTFTAEYKKAVKRLNNLYRSQIKNETLSDEKSDLLLAGITADHILLNWSGLKANGKEHKYTRENAIALLTDPRYAELGAWINAQSESVANFRVEAVK
ncbi:MAG: hypothetical protein GY774_04725 [Planctomycetes bacterium]|nr:hypothetical protein [Planctomycetota bacterium]